MKRTWAWGLIGAGLVGGALVGLAALLGGGRRAARGPFLVLGDSIGSGVAGALARLGHTVVDRSRVGAGTAETIEGLRASLDVAPPGATVVLSTGMNSLDGDMTQLISDIVWMVHAIRAEGFRVLALTPPPIWFETNESMMVAAERLTVALQAMRDVVDLQDLLGDDEGFPLPELMNDGNVHPTAAGYNVIARSILAGE